MAATLAAITAATPTAAKSPEGQRCFRATMAAGTGETSALRSEVVSVYSFRPAATCFGRLQEESNNDQVVCSWLGTGFGVIGTGHVPGAPPTAGQGCHSNPRSMRTGYASHCEWCLHQNSHPTCRQQVRSWSDLLTSHGRREAAFLFSRWMSEVSPSRHIAPCTYWSL
jgi:hypothetical protein